MIRILSLDDEPQMLDILSLILRRTGCEHLTTTDNYEAWALLHTLPVHLFTQDLMRPEMDGWQFLYCMQAEASLTDVPVAIITANAQPTSRARAIDFPNVDTYLAKPFRAQELLNIVDKTLAKRYAVTWPAEKHALGSWPAAGRKYHKDLTTIDNLNALTTEEINNDLWWALRTPPYPNIGLIFSALLNGETDIRFMAAKALGNIRPSTETTQRLIQTLTHQNPDVRWSAALALGRQKTHQAGAATIPDAIPPLIATLSDDHPIVRMWVTLALGHTGDVRATDALTQALEDDYIPVRQAVVLALGWIDAPQAIEALSAALQDTHDIVRIMGAQALSHINDARGIDALRIALDDSNANVRETAAKALGRIKDARAIDALLHALHDPVAAVSANAAKALVYIGGPARAPLLRKLGDRDPQVRQVIVASLRYAQDNSILPLLIDALENEVPAVRSMAAQTLGNFHDRQAATEAIPALLAARADKDFNVSWAAATALRRLGYTSDQQTHRSTDPGN